MIIMALDHVRDFIHRGAMLSQQATNLATTTPILFMTRWITHFCAPVFMFTAGMGALFYLQHGRTRAQLARFLVTRGTWLIFLELTLMQLLYNFGISSQYPIFLLVLYVLGACMIILAALIWLPLPLLTVLSIATIVLHHLLDGPRSTSALWMLLHQQGAFPFGGRVFIAAYQLVPWFAVMSLGYCTASVFSWEPARRQRLLWRAGIAMTIAFLVLRVVNSYGDPSRWSWQPTATFTVLSVLNTTKYPPSLMFLLMTLGPTIAFLAGAERARGWLSGVLATFGRVPMFYYLLHIPLIHGTALLVWMMRDGAARGERFASAPYVAIPPDERWSLALLYLVFVVVVAALYPLCRWYGRLKATSQAAWLRYI